MYISDLFTVVGYLHIVGFKNRRGTFCTKCKYYISESTSGISKGCSGCGNKFTSIQIPPDQLPRSHITQYRCGRGSQLFFLAGHKGPKIV